MMFLLLTVLLSFVKGFGDSRTDESHKLGLYIVYGHRAEEHRAEEHWALGAQKYVHYIYARTYEFE
ncbi:hypothetical protein C7B67_28890 [filamentous cyanobacterium Phorm 6]|nr:hypothetical protein C7B67_28890 [filamentous cyanobacterium Phorm 6]